MSADTAFKNRIDRNLLQRLADSTRDVWPSFDGDGFVEGATTGIEKLALKARVDHAARCWRTFLPESYEVALEIVVGTLGPKLDGERGWGDAVFSSWIHAQFVQVFGLDHLDVSLRAMVEITQRGTAEFAVRPYLRHHTEKTLAFLETQLDHESPHVRRWVSEGMRPRLPWGERLEMFIADPAPNLEILRALNGDRSLYVRTSVANHLGDIAKDHPETAVAEAVRWIEAGVPLAEWIARKGLRLLIKQGHPGALTALGFSEGTRATLHDLHLDKSRARIGDTVTFRFVLKGAASEKLSIDYALASENAAGKPRRKIFKLAVRSIKKGESIAMEKIHSLKEVTTRKLYLGAYRLSVLVNGKELGSAVFKLVS